MIRPEVFRSTAASRRMARSFALGAVTALAAAGSAWPLQPAAGSPTGLADLITKALPGLEMTPASVGLSFTAALACGLAAAWVGAAVQPRRTAWGLVLAASLLALTQSLLLALRHTLWEPLPAILAMLGGCLAASWRGALPAGASPWFRDRVSPALLEKLSQTRDPAFLSPGQREGTVLTCRLLNEAALREVMPAPDFLKLCEAFRARAAEALLPHGACLDPTESTGIRAFFGLPLASETAADDAVNAALALEAAFRKFTSEAAAAPAFPGPPPPAPVSGSSSGSAFPAVPATAAGAPNLSPPPSSGETPALRPLCGAGLASGTFTAGLTGGAYTIFGDAVETSRWLASQNAAYHTRTLLDHPTHLLASRIEDRPLEVLNPPEGAAMEIFHLLGVRGGLSVEELARRDAFQDAIILLRAGHAADAIARFADAREGLTEPDHALEQFLAEAADQVRRDGPAAASASAAAASPVLPLPLPPRRRLPFPRKLPRP